MYFIAYFQESAINRESFQFINRKTFPLHVYSN